MPTVKICPRCGAQLICRHDDMTIPCDCTKVKLEKKHFDYIRRHYDNCLCLDCLRAIEAMTDEELQQ